VYGMPRPTRKPNKQPRKLTHEQKREFARTVIAGAMVKQAAAQWGLSLNAAYAILSEYTITLRIEKFPRDPSHE